jgi:hypothetical protein
MPCSEYEWIEKSEILNFEEITRVARLFVQLGRQQDQTDGRRAFVTT